MDFELYAFLHAITADWVGIVSGVVSLILLLAGFFEQATLQRRMLWSAGLICFGLLSVRVWTIEHKKLDNEIAFLESDVTPFYTDGAPTGFPTGRPMRLRVLWNNAGASPARHVTDASFKLYAISTNGRDDLNRALSDFKSSYTQEIAIQLSDKEQEYVDLFPNEMPQRYLASGAILTDDLARTIFGEKRETILVVGALRYSDGVGQHEAHVCRWLTGIDPGNIEWTDCPEYAETIDIK